VTSAGLGKLVWPGAILAGLALLGLVALAWPEPTTRIVRLPYGESQPKTPRETVVAARETRVTAPVETGRVTARAGATEDAPAGEDPGRVLAVAEPDQSFAGGPAPVPSALELLPGYVQEAPEKLGAQPLPGAVLTPAPPVAR
jgi:hypothetical protein